MAVFDELHSASFKGAVFYVQDATTTGGRKQVKHEFPNSSKQSIEDLGFQPRNFKMKAMIIGETPTDARGYFQKRDQLLSALEQGGAGTLSHPFFSNSIRVVARNWTLNESTKNIGYGSIDLEFDYSDAKTAPQRVPNTLSEISSLTDVLNTSLEESIASVVNTSSIANFADMVNQATDFAGQIATSAVGSVSAALSEVNNLAITPAQYINKVTDMALKPVLLAQNTMSLIQSQANVYPTARAAFDNAQRFFSFGDELPKINPTTVNRTRRVANRKVYNTAVKAGFLGLAYNAAAQSEFGTVDEIDSVQQILETQYRSLIDSDLPDEVLDAVINLRTVSVAFLEAKKLNASQVISEFVNQQPLTVTAYAFYAEQDNFDELQQRLIDLNRPLSNDISFVGGEIKVLTA